MKTSIIILTYNQLPLTHACLLSIRKHTTEPYEIIIVDNGSTDHTVPFLRLFPEIKVISNEVNLGFAKGCNLGLEAATGDYILFLNNDTVVTENWLTNMIRVLEQDHRTGMVGPVTNYVSGYQKIPVTYTDLSQLEEFSQTHRALHAGLTMEARRLVGFCLLTKKRILDEIGGFDERFGLGNYEDDDLCLRVLYAGYKLYIVRDSFIHHVGHATMNQLNGSSLSQLLVTNRDKAAEKWGAEIISLLYRPPVTISFCILVRNLDEQFMMCMKSIDDVADEIILVDAGSAGLTKELVDAYTDKWFITNEIEEWEARNMAFRQASKDYLYWMDSDEMLTERNQRKLRGLKHSLNPMVDAVTMKSYREVDTVNEALGVERLIRLVRRTVPFTVHAQTKEIAVEGTVYHSDVEINKTP
ncbi:glycosyltransferase family 2 protein [Paenibacillus oryzisoli]|uniref:Glycosyltransferase 2-like domain-containing protein n=1 Tax=Paenibacillus oryzisoli TaxID=1850517 RepID=A0A198AC39_9BACL|nr:glycosyltransferase family 2 protein [Paenibacillus oryzisoli]OAS19064.1 hypothetical protein A8708_27455 [Paenibacillus oryzisoli]